MRSNKGFFEEKNSKRKKREGKKCEKRMRKEKRKKEGGIENQIYTKLWIFFTSFNK